MYGGRMRANSLLCLSFVVGDSLLLASAYKLQILFRI
jgi:hypothetical protein